MGYIQYILWIVSGNCFDVFVSTITYTLHILSVSYSVWKYCAVHDCKKKAQNWRNNPIFTLYLQHKGLYVKCNVNWHTDKANKSVLVHYLTLRHIVLCKQLNRLPLWWLMEDLICKLVPKSNSVQCPNSTLGQLWMLSGEIYLFLYLLLTFTVSENCRKKSLQYYCPNGVKRLKYDVGKKIPF